VLGCHSLRSAKPIDHQPTRCNGLEVDQFGPVQGFGLRRKLLPLVGAGILVGCLGVTTPAHATTPSFGSQTADAIIAQTRAAMSSAGSVSASGKGSMKISGVGNVTVSEHDYSSMTSGTQILQITSTHVKAGTTLPSASVLDVGGQLFVDANAPFWASSAGLTDAEAVNAANRWVQIQPSSPLYATAAADLTMPSLLTDLFSSHNFHKGNVRTIDGVRSIAITYTNTGEDSGHATCYVALGENHLPVSISLGGESFRFSSWGQMKAVTAPPNPAQLSNILPPSESTT
jgi:hypothetical protein